MDRLSHLNFAFSVSKNELRPEGAKILTEALHVNSSMTFLDVSSNELTKGKHLGFGDYETAMMGIQAIADSLSVSSSLKSLM